MKGRQRTHNEKSSLTRPRELRGNLTPAEALLWLNLKDSALDGKKFRRQHGIGPYIVDFYCPECRVIVELDGDGHYGILAEEKDDIRTRFLEKLGMRVLRFENCQVIGSPERVLDAIQAVLRGLA